MPTWTPEEHLAFDIAFALKKVTVPGFRKPLNEEDRFAIATTILDQDRAHLVPLVDIDPAHRSSPWVAVSSL